MSLKYLVLTIMGVCSVAVAAAGGYVAVHMYHGESARAAIASAWSAAGTAGATTVAKSATVATGTIGTAGRRNVGNFGQAGHAGGIEEAEIGPLLDEFAVLGPELDTLVLPVLDDQLVFRVD